VATAVLAPTLQSSVDRFALRGKFVAKSAKVPKGAPFPVGSVLTVVIDVRSMKVTD